MLSTLRFVVFTVISVALLFTAVYVTILNTYKPVIKAYIDGEFIGYFSDEQQFDEIYNDLVTEKKKIDENVKVYLDSEPTFEACYIKDSLLKQQNVYTNLRAEIKTEYTVYELVVDGEEQMTFTAENQAEDYVEKLKSEVSDINADINVEKVSELENVTSIDRADTILAEIVDRNKPVETPPPAPVQTAPVYATTVYTGPVIPAVSGNKVWPTSGRGVNCEYGEYFGHSGIDLSAHMGSQVFSFMEGTVVFSGWDPYGLGYCVKVDHGNGLVTVYGHNSSLVVSAGQYVSAGQLISYSGSTGNSTGPHLHFETRVNGVSVNPRIYLNQL